MKKIFRLLLILSAVLTAVSCGTKGPEISTAIVGEWQLVSVSGQTSVPEVYVNFAQDLSFELYQKIGEGRLRKYQGTYTVTETIVSGVYSDGKAWGSDYEASFEGENLVLTAQNGSAEVCTYKKQALSETDKAGAILVTKSSSEEEDSRYL